MHTLCSDSASYAFDFVSRLLAREGWHEIVTVQPKLDSDNAVELWRDDNGAVTIERQISSQRDLLLLRFGEMLSVAVDLRKRKLSISVDGFEVTEPTLNHLFLDQVIPRILAHEGNLILHAGLVATGTTGMIVCGSSGLGKSTLVASLQRAGYLLHGDDALVVEAGDPPFLARSVYPSLRVLPDTLERLFPEGPEVRTVAHYSDKLRVSLPVGGGDLLLPVPLTALTFLAPPPADAEIKLRPMRPAEACMALIENSFALDPTEKARALDKLVKASDLAAAVPAFELSYPRDYDRLDDVRRTLVDAGILPPLDAESPVTEPPA